MPQLIRFPLPDVGEGLTEADIVEWKVAAGQAVAVHQVLVEIETAKSLVELPSPHAGVIVEVLAAEGDTVDVGTPIIVIDADPGKAEGDGDGTAGSTGTGPEKDDDAAPKDALADHGHGNGRAAAASGGTDVLVGYGTKGVRPRRRRRTVAAPTPAAASARGSHDGRVLAKPPVRKLAKDLGVDLPGVAGTGPGGIVTREDVLDAQPQRAAPSTTGGRSAKATAALDNVFAPGSGDLQPWLEDGAVSADGRLTRVAVRGVRRRTAQAVTSSAFTAPHVTEFITVDVTRTMKLVHRLKADPDFADVRITPLLIAAKALLLAIRRNPQISASWDEAAEEIVYKHYVNLGIAAATPRGLLVPNIKDAHRMTLHELAAAIGDLTRAARAGKTTPAAMSDGTVTITNIGVFGIDTGTPILNPGESAILALGAIDQRPWVHKGKIKPRWVTQLALSFDHRLVDGELGSRVLADVAGVMADPAQALVWG